jgi:hypothetical protein
MRITIEFKNPECPEPHRFVIRLRPLLGWLTVEGDGQVAVRRWILLPRARRRSFDLKTPGDHAHTLLFEFRPEGFSWGFRRVWLDSQPVLGEPYDGVPTRTRNCQVILKEQPS